jgi:hypothetical protein
VVLPLSVSLDRRPREDNYGKYVPLLMTPFPHLADVCLAMSLLRMIKQFGYEQIVEKQIAEKRENELALIWKRKLLGLLVSIITVL